MKFSIMFLIQFVLIIHISVAGNLEYFESTDTDSFESELSTLANDINGNKIDDSLEIMLYKTFMPKIWGDPEEGCGPNQLNAGWCKDGTHPARHSKGFIGCHVKYLRFANLWAIEYTVFLDRDCGSYGIGKHFFDSEGFTVLVRKVDSDYKLVSVQSVAHHNTQYEIVDRYFPHELYRYSAEGLLMSKNKHGIYVHRRICDGALDSAEDCPRYPDHKVLLNNGVDMVSNLYNAGACPCCTTLGDQSCMSCWERNLTHSGCFAKNLHRYGLLEIGVCNEYDSWTSNLRFARKQVPPFIPMSISIPDNYPYVEIWEYPNFTFNPGRNVQRLKDNFGSDLVNAGMPMRLFCFGDWGWWREYYDIAYQKTKNEKSRGLSSHAHRYKYWTDSDADIHYINETHSIRLHGLPGTVLAIYDHNNGYFKRLAYKVIPNGSRTLSIGDVKELETMEFISWGFGPTADAGPDRAMKLDSLGFLTLDGTASFKYTLPETALIKVYGLSNFDFHRDWTYKWYINEGGFIFPKLTHIGDGVQLKTNKLKPGKYKIRLQVWGWRYPWPDDPTTKQWVSVWDQCEITVDEHTDITIFDDHEIPSTFILEQNYPNPFNPTTEIKFSLPRACNAVLEIFNIQGQLVATLTDRSLPAGNYTATWDGTTVFGNSAASGVYFYRLHAGEFTEIKKMILLK
jgi:hypothetical protein